MTPALQAHAYVLTRFARLSAPESALSFEIGLLQETFIAAGGDWEAVRSRIEGALQQHERQIRPLVERAKELLPAVLPPSRLDLSHDPFYLARRARSEEWKLKDPAGLEEIFRLDAECNTADQALLEQLQCLLSL